MADRLTDKPSINGETLSLSDLLHIVDVSDTTDNPEGSSFKTTIYDILLKRTFIWSSNALILRRYSTSGNTEPRDGIGCSL